MKDFKLIVQEKTTVPLDRIRLIYQAHVLEDDKLLSDYIKEDGQVVHLMAKLERPPDA